MSGTQDENVADGIREGGPAGQRDEVSDEVRLDLDESKLDTWDEVRGDYAVDDPESEMTRPALTEQEEDDADDVTPPREDDEEDDLAEDDGDDEDGRADEEE